MPTNGYIAEDLDQSVSRLIYRIMGCYVADKAVEFLDEITSPESDSGSPATRRSHQTKKVSTGPGRSAKEPKKLVLHVYGMSFARIDSAIQAVDDLCKDAKKQKILKKPAVQDFMSRITDDQVCSILSVFCNAFVSFTFNHTVLLVLPIKMISHTLHRLSCYIYLHQ